MPDRDITANLRISRPTLRKFRIELAKANYIRFKPGDGTQDTGYMLCMLNGTQRPTTKPTEAYQSIPKPTKQEAPTQGSFDTDDFWNLAVKASFGDDDMG